MAKSKSKVSLKPASAAAKNSLANAMDAVESHVSKILPYWPKMDDTARQKLLDDSPQLARFIALVERFRNGN